MSVTTKLLDVAEVVIDCGTQVRAEISETTVAQYAEDMTNGDTFPNVICYFDGNRYMLADGFHRFMAFSRAFAGEKIRCEVHKGTRADALKYALSANYSHGLRRSNADKKRSVELALAEWPKISDREIARICSVSHNFVSEHRAQLSSDDSSTRIGADGKTRKVPAKPAEAVEEHEAVEEDLGTSGQSELSSHEQRWATQAAERAEAPAKVVLTKAQQAFCDEADVAITNLRYIVDAIMEGNAIQIDETAIAESRAELAKVSKLMGKL